MRVNTVLTTPSVRSALDSLNVEVREERSWQGAGVPNVGEERNYVTVYLTLHCCPPSPRGLPFTWWGCCGLCFSHQPAKLAHSVLFRSCVCFSRYGPFNCISFRQFSRQLSAFSLCSSGVVSVLLFLLTAYLFVKIALSPDIILCDWLGLKH